MKQRIGENLLVTRSGSSVYVPDQGDIVWLNFNPQAGREQNGRRPAIVITPIAFNNLGGLAMFCPITSKVKGYPFEVLLPEGLMTSGVILSHHLKSLDWRERKVEFIEKVPQYILIEVSLRIKTLLP